MTKILITPKINPDLDGVASAYAYAKFLNATDKSHQYIAGLYGRPQIEARFLLEKLNIKDGIVFNPTNDFDKFIIVDASDLKGMPAIIRPQDVIEVIDHRATHNATALFPNAKIQIELVGAAATLILEKLKSTNFLENQAGLLLYGAIFSNTLNFKSDLATDRDQEAVEFIDNNFNSLIPENIITAMFISKTTYINENLEEVLRDDFKIFDYSGKLGIAQIEGFDLNDLVNKKRTEINQILEKLKKENNLDYIFLTAADINNNQNIFLVIDKNSQNLLEKKLALTFNSNNIAQNPRLLLRKQILPLLLE